MTKVYNEEFINLNMDYINKTSQSDIIKLLTDRTNNLEHNNFSMDYKRIITITAIDHYICKKLVSGGHDIRMSTYFNELFNQLKRQPLLFLSLPIRNVPLDLLRKYMPQIDAIKSLCDLKWKEVLLIADKFNKAEKLKKEGKKDNTLEISNDELAKLVTYFNYSCTYDNNQDEIEIQDKVVKLLMDKNVLGLRSSSFIMKYFGYKKCREEGLDDIQIFVGDLTSRGENVAGISLNKTVIISKKHLVGTNFKNNALLDEFAKVRPKTYEGLICLKNLFHELRHAVQDRDYYDKKKTDTSYSMSVRNLLNVKNEEEYGRDYKYYDIEADANFYGWRWVREVIKNYMGLSEKERLDMYADIYATGHMIRRDFTAKKEDKKINTAVWGFITRKLDLVFKNNPSLLQGEYSHFKVFYNENGSPKDVNLLIRLDSRVASNFPDMFFNMISGRLSQNREIDINYIQTLPLDSKKNIIRNLNEMIYHVYGKLSDIKIETKDGNYLLDSKEFSEADRIVFRKSVENYFNMVEKYSKLASDIVRMNPELVGYYGGPTHINTHIKNINKNELVKSCVGGRQIERIPENTNDLVSSEGKRNGRN